ncbi:hypothetical protein [Helicobacter pylori]|uniref:hypothetical protein n=1 Tax=Helicobacter pylori TaxID=210 RepID=UPI001920D2FF|nr:hypothetical protein [Helicobacter pylori]QQW82117.1 hypothetical protein HG571_03285 [Helicobacter pylori]
MILAVRKENLSGVTNSVNKKISRLEAEGTKLDKKLINNEFVCKINRLQSHDFSGAKRKFKRRY